MSQHASTMFKDLYKLSLEIDKLHKTTQKRDQAMAPL
jgi:hypothetical protein